MRRLIVLAAALVLAGCVDDEVPTVRWSKPGGTYDAFVADRESCVMQTRRETRPFILGGQRFGEPNGDVLDASRFVPCMNALGYHEDPKGFAAPPGDEIPLAP